MNHMERTLVLIKPDAVEKGVCGEIIKRYEQAGLKLQGLKMLRMTESLASRHYAEHAGRPYYEKLVRFMTSGPLIAAALYGEDAIAKVRALNGATDPQKAERGTIRADFAVNNTVNAVHASDSPQNAAREIGLFFSENELY